MRTLPAIVALTTVLAVPPGLWGQSINSGTVSGTVTDPTGALVPNAAVELSNPVSGHHRSTKTDSTGTYRFNNVPQNQYRIRATAPGFAPTSQMINVRGTVPVVEPLVLAVAGETTSVTVEASGGAMVEVDPAAHEDVDRSRLSKLPMTDPAGGLSQAITMSTGSVAADGNGFFHPLGDHAQTSFVVDGQPISDQQSKVFSTQLPTSAIQGMELITGMPNAEYGDKSSLVAQISTRSGLGAHRTFGNVDTTYGSFGTSTTSLGLGFGSDKLGHFLAVDGTRSGRFLDAPEFSVFHDIGNNESIFDRLDFQPTARDTFHLNLFAARNWIQIPNTYDQLTQDQRQRVLTWNIAPGYQRTLSAHALLSVNAYMRQDQFSYYGSRDPLADTPATQDQRRRLMNYGLRSDLSISEGRHNLKFGLDVKQTRLYEGFDFAISDPAFNAPCLNGDGAPAGPLSATDPGVCSGYGYTPNPDFHPALVRYDLTRGGSLFQFNGRRNINQYAVYLQDGVTAGNWQINFGLRGDAYYGITQGAAVEPRAGLAYHVKRTSTVLRASYNRSFETPFNENLILSSASSGGLAESIFGAAGVRPVEPGRRNQYNAGLQQGFGRYLVADVDYFWKDTRNAYDFATLLNTTITFPIAWHQSKIDGISGRLSTSDIHGFLGYWTFGHNRARFFPPESGGLLSEAPAGVFRIDHDQAFQSTVNLRYQRRNAEWISFIWRYDSGQVVSGVADAAAALALTPNQQVTLGLACDGTPATVGHPITSCLGRVTSKLITLPPTGTANDDHNPDRVRSRNIYDVGIGTDNLLHADGARRVRLSLMVTNLANSASLYNFLSTFSGTHFLEPRAVQASLGYVF